MKKFFTIIVLFSVIGLSSSSGQTVCTSDTIIPIANLPAVRSELRSVSYNSELYVFGGYDNSSIVNSAYKFSPANNTWSTLTNMPTARAEIGAAEINGIVYCIGGLTGSPSNKNEAYNISTDTWQTLANLPNPITGCDGVSLNNKVYVIGGTLGITNSYFYEYDPSTNTYSNLAAPSQKRMHGRLVTYNNKIFLVGGHYFNGTYNSSNKLDEYDPLTNTWTSKATMPINLQKMGAAVYDNKLYVFGGTTEAGTITPLNSFFVYNFASDSWTTMSNLPFSCAATEAITSDNIVYLLGGNTSSTTATDLCYKYGCLNYICQQIIYDTVHIAVTDTLIINTVLTGITPPNNKNTVKVYPNPANTHIYINCGNYASMNGYTIRIDNSLAQTVYTTPVEQQQYFVDLSGWTGNGTYFVYIIDNLSNIIDIRKIILQ